MTSFNDKKKKDATDELFTVLLRVCTSVCACLSGVNNSEKKPFVFRGGGEGGVGGAKAKTHLKHMGGNHIESSEQ